MFRRKKPETVSEMNFWLLIMKLFQQKKLWKVKKLDVIVETFNSLDFLMNRARNILSFIFSFFFSGFFIYFFFFILNVTIWNANTLDHKKKFTHKNPFDDTNFSVTRVSPYSVLCFCERLKMTILAFSPFFLPLPLILNCWN